MQNVSNVLLNLNSSNQRLCSSEYPKTFKSRFARFSRQDFVRHDFLGHTFLIIHFQKAELKTMGTRIEFHSCRFLRQLFQGPSWSLFPPEHRLFPLLRLQRKLPIQLAHQAKVCLVDQQFK